MAEAASRVDYSPIIERPPIRWPGGARVALWIAPNIEHYEYLPEFDGVRTAWPRMPIPDVQQYSYRDYGNRVGFWRMTDVLDKHGIRCCVSLNLAVLEHYPEIAEAMIERNYDFMSHGIYNTRLPEHPVRGGGAGVLPGQHRDPAAPHREAAEGHAGPGRLRHRPHSRPDGRGRAYLPHRLGARRSAGSHPG